VTRANDRSRLTSEFVRAAVRKLQQHSGSQRERLSLAG
jgi:Arc/MetJ-type ribon-helix-helix transcriptional regulator